MIKSLRVETLVPDLKGYPDEFKKLLPERNSQVTTFDFVGINSPIANALRRVLIDEVPIRALQVDYENIKTDDSFIFPDQIKLGIEQIPVDQDTPVGTEFTLRMTNRTTTSAIIYSRTIHARGDKKSKLPFDSCHRLGRLNPGKRLTVTGIKVVEGKAMHDAKFTATALVSMNELDHMRVMFVNSAGHWNNINMPTKAVDKLVGTRAYGKRVLILEDINIASTMDDIHKKRMKSYDFVVDKIPHGAASTVRHHQTTEYMANDFRFSFQTEGNVDPEHLLKLAITQIIMKLEQLAAGDQLEMSIDEDLTIFHITNSTHTLSKMIKITMFELNPSISSVRDEDPGPYDSSIDIICRHPNAEKLFKDALGKLIKLFKSLKV